MTLQQIPDFSQIFEACSPAEYAVLVDVLLHFIIKHSYENKVFLGMLLKFNALRHRLMRNSNNHYSLVSWEHVPKDSCNSK